MVDPDVDGPSDGAADPDRSDQPCVSGLPVRTGGGGVRAGHGTVVVARYGRGDWTATWFDLGFVEVDGDQAEVLAWARSRPAAEFLVDVSAPDLTAPGGAAVVTAELDASAAEQQVPLDSPAARLYLEQADP